MTMVPFGYDSLQSPGQLRPSGIEVIVPIPSPLNCAVSVGAIGKNGAVTVLVEFIINVQGPVPLHSPVHPGKKYPGGAVALSVTVVPGTKR